MEEQINERIKKVRELVGLNKTNFGKKIMIKQPSLSNLESGRANPSSQTIALICDRFNVNEKWLRTGEGEMFGPPKEMPSEQKYEAFCERIELLEELGLKYLDKLIDVLISLREEVAKAKKD